MMLNLFRNKKSACTETYSQFGIPGEHFITRDFRLKIIIDPPNDYFTGRLRKDRKDFDKLLLIHGCETPDLNDISASVMKHAGEFTRVLTFDPVVAESHFNASLFCFGSCWVLTDKNGHGVALRKDYQNIFTTQKKFELSFIKSNKNQLPGHKLRGEVTPLLQKPHPFHLNFPQQRIESKVDLFRNAMFHLTIENSRYTNYITEKVIDCFMSYTIPIYWGCPNIGDYFDSNGIITFQAPEELEQILNTLTPEIYQSKLASITRNYEIAKNDFAFFFDRVNSVIETL